jgi:hypothetical protein
LDGSEAIGTLLVRHFDFFGIDIQNWMIIAIVIIVVAIVISTRKK